MTINEYNSLPKAQRSDILWEWAFFIARKKELDHTIVLFSLKDFFIEVIIELDNRTQSIRAISKETALEKHSGILNQIDNPVLSFSFH